jgi:hypothetical protein
MPAVTRHFFIAGAQRSGTTWLYRMLEQHPRIAMAGPVRPEPKFFITDALYERGIAHYHERYFPDRDRDWLGEKSTSYIEHPLAAQRIARHFPDALVLFLLRDPVERALSNYRFSVDNGLEPLPLEQALGREPARAAEHAGTSVSPHAYAGRGHYVRYLDRWREHFPAAQLLPMVSEQVLGSEAAVRALFARLGLDAGVPLRDVALPVNHASPPREPVPARVRDRLRGEFQASNRALAERYAVDTGQWQ